MAQTSAEDPFTADQPATPRPPTPPRESPRSERVADLAPCSGIEPLHLTSSPISSRDTSPPTSSAESASGKPKKRVVWSGWTTYHKPEASPLTPSNPRKVRPSASTDPRPLKSILKHSSASPYLGSPTPSSEQPFLAHTHASFTNMLDSVVQALGSPERSKKLDTYIAFCNTLRAYDDVPDWEAMEKKIPVLCGYLKRDLVAKMEDGGNPDSQLIQQAIKLLTIICWYERLVNAMDDQNASFFIQHAIQKIEEPQTSKASVTLYLHFLAQQRFPAPKIMTTERCNRIVTALETLDERVTGKSITKERIDIYYKLLSLSRSTMIARASDWMRNAFGGLLNHVKEVRTRSLIFLREAAMVMGKEKSVARTISIIFNQDNEGKRMFESIRSRLEHFVKKEHEGQYVSQLWAVLLLLTQSFGDKWEFFTPWLRIIETCFNVSEPDVKVEAQLAWSKLIYVSNIGPNTQRKLLELMCKPVEQYLDPKNATSNTRKPRRAALSNVCVYLYYGFRPNATPKQLSEIWDVVVVGLIQNLVLTGSEFMDGCNILCSLFDGTAQKRWAEDRLLIGHPFMKVDEIPRLDPKWVRPNCDKVLKTVEAAIERAAWEDNDDSPGARLLWKRFMRTLADAGSKEIKISPELMEAVSHIFNMFQRLWNQGPTESQSASSISFIERFTFLVEVALDSLGTLCFTEKQLAIDDKSKFIPASTPTHKYSSDSNNSHRYPPVLHIVRLLMEPPPGVYVDELYLNCARRILDKCCASQDSRRKKLYLLASCETLLPRREAGAVHLGLWDILAELTRDALPPPTRENTLISPSPLGGEFKDAVQVLKWGSLLPVSGWEQLFQELTAVIQNELGEAYVSMIVIGPLAESLRYSKTNANLGPSLGRTIVLVEKAKFTKIKPTIESMFKGIYGSDRKPTNTDALESLYSLTNYLLQKSYEASDPALVALGNDLCGAAIDLVARAPSGSVVPLKQMQEGLGIWAKDPAHRVTKNNGFLSLISATEQWERLLASIETLPRHDSEVLSSLKGLLSNGFESRRKLTVNATIKTWNATFGKQPTLIYPPRLRTALAKLKTVTDTHSIFLPGFPKDDSGIYTPPVFESEESQSVDEIPWSSPTPARAQWFPDLSSRGPSPTLVVKETPFIYPRRTLVPGPNATPTAARAKLKHMDSQISFTAVDDTPEFETQDPQLLTERQKEVRVENAETAGMFPEITGSVVKRKKGLKLAAGSPTPNRKLDFAQTPVAEKNEERVPETTVEGLKDTEPIFSFTSDPRSGTSAAGSVNESSGSRSQMHDDRSSELTDIDSDNDVAMSNYEFSEPTKALEPQADTASDVPSVEEMFVDAPEHPNAPELAPVQTKASDYGKISPLKDISEIAILVSPVKNITEYEPVDISDPDSPPARQQKSTAEKRATPAAAVTPQKGKAGKKLNKKRKRTASAPGSPEVLDTIIIAESEQSPQDPEPPSKKPKASDSGVDTPIRISARKTKGKTGVRGTASKLSAGSDVDGMGADQSYSPTPSRARPNPAKRLKLATAPREKSPVKERLPPDVSFTQDTEVSESFNSSIQDSQPPVQVTPKPSKILPTPTKVFPAPTKQKDRSLFLDADADELQLRSPRHSMSEPDISENVKTRVRRSRRKSGFETTMQPPQTPRKAPTEPSPSKSAKKKEKSALEALKKALVLVEQADMTEAEMASAEDAMFDAFTKMRDKKRRVSGIK